MSSVLPSAGDQQPLLDHAAEGYGAMGKQAESRGKHLSMPKLIGLNAFVCLYGALVSAMGVIILPREMERMFEAEHAVALGLVVGLAGLSQLICPLAGFLSDRCSSQYGRRRPYLVMSSAFSGLFLFFLWIARENKWGYAFMFIFLFAMIGLNIAYACYTGLVSDIVPESQMGTASGVMGVLTMVGASASIASVGWILEIGNSYFVYLALMAVTVPITVFCGAETPVEDQGPLEWSDMAGAYHISYETHGDFFLVFVSRTLYYVAVSVQTFLLFYLRDVIHISEAEAKTHTATLCLIAQISAACVSLPAGALSDRLGRKRFIYASCSLMATVYTGYIFSRTFLVVAIFAGIYGIGNGTYVAVDYALASQTLPNPATVARDLGLWGIAAFLGMMIGPVLCGPALYLFGKTANVEHYSLQGYVILMGMGAVMSLCSASVVSRISNKHK